MISKENKNYFLIMTFSFFMGLLFVMFEFSEYGDKSIAWSLLNILAFGIMGLLSSYLYYLQGKNANVDSLTGLYNQSHMWRTLEQIKKNQYISIVLIDIDNFKETNDSMGHLVGNNVIIFLTQLIKSHFPKDSIPIRFGGDEFAVVIKNLSNKEAEILAEEFRQLVFMKKKPGLLSVSIGLASGRDKTDGNILFEAADKMLYESKKERNKTCNFGMIN